MENFYDNLDLKYPEIAVVAERFHVSSNTAQFYIPVLMPYKTNTVKTTSTPNRPSGLMNKDNNIGLSNYTTGSTIRLRVPRWILSDAPRDEYGYVYKDTEFVIVFIGGDINKPTIIGGNW